MNDKYYFKLDIDEEEQRLYLEVYDIFDEKRLSENTQNYVRKHK